MSIRCHLAGFAVLSAVTAVSAAESTVPPIKPGLWQVQSEHLIDGKKAPDPSEQLKALSPEVRKQLESSMRQYGIDTRGGPGQTKMCLTREALDQGRWQGQQGACKTEFTSRSDSVWTWHSTCTQPPAESDGEATFQSPERYSVKIKTKMSLLGTSQASAMSMTGQWLGADCGDLKPLKTPPASGVNK